LLLLTVADTLRIGSYYHKGSHSSLRQTMRDS